MLSEYYNWLNVCNPGSQIDKVKYFVRKLDIEPSIKCEAEAIFLEELLFERKIDQSRAFYEDLQLYNYSKRTIEELMMNGAVEKKYAQLMRTLLKKKKKKELDKKRKKRKNALKKLAKPIIRRLRKIKNNLLRGENDVKR